MMANWGATTALRLALDDVSGATGISALRHWLPSLPFGSRYRSPGGGYSFTRRLLALMCRSARFLSASCQFPISSTALPDTFYGASTRKAATYFIAQQSGLTLDGNPDIQADIARLARPTGKTHLLRRPWQVTNCRGDWLRGCSAGFVRGGRDAKPIASICRRNDRTVLRQGQSNDAPDMGARRWRYGYGPAQVQQSRCLRQWRNGAGERNCLGWLYATVRDHSCNNR